MGNKLINGRALALDIEKKIELKMKMLKEEQKNICLKIIRLGENKESSLYIKNKIKACQRLGIKCSIEFYDSACTEKELIDVIKINNNDPNVNGIIVQLPLPLHINAQNVMRRISSLKDVDGFHPQNVGKLVYDKPLVMPATVNGITLLMSFYNIDVKGKNAVVIGRSNIVGKPLANWLINKGATVTVCNSQTKDLRLFTKNADLLFVATGQKWLIDETFIKDRVIIFDVGTTREGGKIYGDVDFSSVYDKVDLITPVPGGVGPMTVAGLLLNLVMLAEIQEVKKNNMAVK